MPIITPDSEREMPTNAEWRSAMRSARDKLEISQAELARRVGTTQATISDVERGAVESSQHIMAISKELGIQPPIWTESDLDRRWIEAGRVLHSKYPTIFEGLLRSAEAIVAAREVPEMG